MILHFGSTSPRFDYFHYLAVVSACMTQDVDETIIYVYREPETRWWNLVEDLCKVKRISDDDLPSGSELKHPAYTNDYLSYKFLYEDGGLYLDLDTFSFMDITDLLKKELFVSFQTPSEWKTNHPIAHTPILVKPKSEIMAQALAYSLEALKRESITWGDTGPVAISNAILKLGNPRRVDIAPYEEFCYYSWGDSRPYEEIPDLPLGRLKSLHLWAKLNPFLDKFTPEWIEGSQSLYARLVKSTLPKEDWKP
jgi:hypothetical protein